MALVQGFSANYLRIGEMGVKIKRLHIYYSIRLNEYFMGGDGELWQAIAFSQNLPAMGNHCAICGANCDRGWCGGLSIL